MLDRRECEAFSQMQLLPLPSANKHTYRKDKASDACHVRFWLAPIQFRDKAPPNIPKTGLIYHALTAGKGRQDLSGDRIRILRPSSPPR